MILLLLLWHINVLTKIDERREYIIIKQAVIPGHTTIYHRHLKDNNTSFKPEGWGYGAYRHVQKYFSC